MDVQDKIDESHHLKDMMTSPGWKVILREKERALRNLRERLEDMRTTGVAIIETKAGIHAIKLLFDVFEKVITEGEGIVKRSEIEHMHPNAKVRSGTLH